MLKGGIYGRLCEVCDKTRTGNDFQRLLQKLEKENLVRFVCFVGFLCSSVIAV